MKCALLHPCDNVCWRVRTLRTNFSEIVIEIQIVSFRKMHLKLSFAKSCPFCLGLNVSTGLAAYIQHRTPMRSFSATGAYIYLLGMCSCQYIRMIPYAIWENNFPIKKEINASLHAVPFLIFYIYYKHYCCCMIWIQLVLYRHGVVIFIVLFLWNNAIKTHSAPTVWLMTIVQ